jgi:TonB family protein
MSGLESVIVSYVLNSLWQVPLLFAAAWIAARLVRAAGPGAEHRVWVGALVLESLLPALSILPWERVHLAWLWQARAASIDDAHVSVQLGGGTGFTALRLPPAAMTALAAVYGVLVFYFTIRFVWQFTRLRVLMRGTETLSLAGDAALSWKRWSDRLGIGRVALVSSTQIFSPVTIGITRKRVLLPAGMASRLAHVELDTAIAHEYAHIWRNDFLKNLFYELLSLPASYHPGLWFTRQQIMETREMVCDEMAAEISGNQEYAQSLLRLASLLLKGRPVRVPHAIGVFDANTLERRLMKLTETKKKVGRARRYASVGACVVLGIATATSALALRIGIDQKASANNESLSKGIPSSVSAKEMQDLVITKVPPVYPPEAKKARIQGKVVLEAVIGKTGHVENLKVLSGPQELQTSALDAVRQWAYKPYLLNGDPIEVATTITVIFRLEK